MSEFIESASHNFWRLCSAWEEERPYYVWKHGHEGQETGWANIFCFSKDGGHECLGEMPLQDPGHKIQHPDVDVQAAIKKYNLKLRVIFEAKCAWEDRTSVTMTRKGDELHIKIE